MTVMVTGGTGFLGSALCRCLESQGEKVISLSSRECDLTKREELRAYEGERYSIIFHLAAWTQAGDFCLHHPGEQWIINQQINTNMLAWWSERQPQAKLVAMGTSCAYAPDSDFRESSYLLGQPIDSLYTYAMTKRMLYEGLRSLHRQYGLRYLCAVPSTLYGPSYHTDGRQMHFIFDLIGKIMRGKELREPVVFWGNGYQRREVVFVDDFAETLWQICGLIENELINIGAGVDYSIREYAERICSIVGYDPGEIKYDEKRYVGALAKLLNIDKLCHIAPLYAPRPLELGLSETIEWFDKSGVHRRS